MQTEIRLKPWDNSQGLRVSREMLRQAGMAPDEALTAEISEGRIVLSKKFRHRSLRERAAAYGGELHLSGEMDWFDEPAGALPIPPCAVPPSQETWEGRLAGGR